jgi:hypothetical protein
VNAVDRFGCAVTMFAWAVAFYIAMEIFYILRSFGVL